MVQTVSPATYRAPLACILFGGIASAFQSACAADDYDVFLLAWQSNMDGRGLERELSEDQKYQVDDASIFYRSVPRTSEGWQQLVPGYQSLLDSGEVVTRAELARHLGIRGRSEISYRSLNYWLGMIS